MLDPVQPGEHQTDLDAEEKRIARNELKWMSNDVPLPDPILTGPFDL